jgi:hypothetical protein
MRNVDETGRIYIMLSWDEGARQLGISRHTFGDALDALENADLIEVVNQGSNRPSRIYVNVPDDDRFIKVPAFYFEDAGWQKESSLTKLISPYLIYLTDIGKGGRNGDGSVYVEISRNDLWNVFGVKETAFMSGMKPLMNLGILETQRRGPGKPNLITVRRPLLPMANNARPMDCLGVPWEEIDFTGPTKFFPAGSWHKTKCPPYGHRAVYLSENANNALEAAAKEITCKEYNTILEQVQHRIKYSLLGITLCGKVGRMLYCQCAALIFMGRKKTVRFGSKKLDAEAVKRLVLLMTSEEIRFFGMVYNFVYASQENWVNTDDSERKAILVELIIKIALSSRSFSYPQFTADDNLTVPYIGFLWSKIFPDKNFDESMIPGHPGYIRYDKT